MGQSKKIYARISTHIYQPKNSKVAETIELNAPRLSTWQIEIMKAEICRDFIQHLYPEFVTKNPITEDLAEQALIHYYRPSLNEIYNPLPRSLPENIIPPKGYKPGKLHVMQSQGAN